MKSKIFVMLLIAVQVSTFTVGAEQNTLLEDINAYRSLHGLRSLEENKTLCKLAEKRVEQIKTDWSHAQFQSEIDGVGNMNGVFYENLARTLQPHQVVWGWSMSQAGHREAMLVSEMRYGCVIQSGNHYVFEGYVPTENIAEHTSEYFGTSENEL